MSSMLNYFRRKFKPRCIGKQSNSFVRRDSYGQEKRKAFNEKQKHKSESKLNASKSKRKLFNFRIKFGLIGDKLSSKSRVAKTNDSKQEADSNSTTHSDDSKKLSSYSYSCSKIDESKCLNEVLKIKENLASLSVEGEFLNSTSLGQTNSSGYVEYATGSSNFCSNNISNPSTTNVSVSSDSSMLTYNTKYAHSRLSDDDGLMSVDCGESMHRSSLSATDNVQQSTPYNENFARIRSLKVRKSSRNG